MTVMTSIMENTVKTPSAFLVGGLLVAMGTAAHAQPLAAYDPEQLPATEGRVAQYSLTPRGDVDGVILDDGTQIHLPPHLGSPIVQTIKPGDTITIRRLTA